MYLPPSSYGWGFFYPPSHWIKITPVIEISKQYYLTLKVFGLFLVALCLWASAISYAYANPQRIISTSPSITEILFAIGVGNRVVAVTDYCKFPPKACRLPNTGGLLNPSVEKWLSLKPDLIIHQRASETIRQNAKNLGIPTLRTDLNSLEDIFEAIQLIADTLKTSDSGKKLVEKLKNKINDTRSRLKGLKPRRVLILLSDTNDPGRDLYAVGRGTFLDELLTIAGGDNVLPDTMARYPKISKEYIIRESPEVIMEVGPKSNLSEKETTKRKESWAKFSTLRAVKDNKIYFIGADYIIIPGPRLINILDDFSRTIHPDLFVEESH